MTYASEMIHHHIVVPAAQSMLEVCQNYNANASEYGAFSAQEQRFYTPFLRNLEILKTQVGKSNGVQGISVFYRHDELLLSTDKTSHWFFYGPGSGYEQDALVYCHTYPIFSSAAVAETSWRLVCLMEENQFYTASTHIIFVIGIICFVTLLVGYMLAYFIANRVYNPLHLLSKCATEQLRSSWHKDDYALINQAISDLSHQVGELQSAIALNAPMVRNQIFSRLLSKQPANLVEIENRLHMVHVDPSAAGWHHCLPGSAAR